MLRDMDIMEDINDIRRVRKTLLLTPCVIRVGLLTIPMISYTVQGRAALEVSCTASRNSKKTDQ